jgi:hypothetical protein
MAWMWSILNKVGPHTSDCINREILDRAQFFHEVDGMSAIMARGKAAGEVNREVKEVYESGGVDAVRERFRCMRREDLADL